MLFTVLVTRVIKPACCRESKRVSERTGQGGRGGGRQRKKERKKETELEREKTWVNSKLISLSGQL